MTLIIERATACTFPKLRITPRERSVNFGISSKARHAQALDTTTALLTHSLAKATGMDKDWERTFAKSITYSPLDRLVQTVLDTQPATNATPHRLKDLEGNLAVTKAMETVVRSLDLLLQLRLGIPSKQAVKRLIKEEHTKPGKMIYRKKLDQLRKDLEFTEDEYGLYGEWKEGINRKTEQMHQLIVSYRVQLTFRLLKGGV